MIKYHCPSCDVDCEFSKCHACGGRTEVQSSVYWCPECNVPVWGNKCPVCGADAKYAATDLRPVFPQERLLLEILLGEPLKFINDSVWASNGGRYIINGRAVKLSRAMWNAGNVDAVRYALEQYADANAENAFDKFAQRWIAANKSRYDYITAEAMQAVQEAAQGVKPEHMFVSFSGGKDSTVTSSLVTRALGTPSIIHLYGDTTLEFPETENYLKRFRAANRKTPVLVARNNDKNFFDMCEIVGPPSRVKRWCCIIFKTGAITRKIEKTYPGVKRLLTFYGIRRNESASRSKYERETESPKISKQVVFSPIIDWLDYDVWLYMLSTGVDFNSAYRAGYTRVGCWCCPNNSAWSEFLSAVYMPDQYARFHSQLIAFARKVGKPDPEEYVAQGGWKARQGGNGLEVSKRFVIGFTPCATEENAFNYELNRPVTPELYELFKPFGTLDFDMGNKRLGEVYVLDCEGTPLLRLQGRQGRNTLKVSILKLPLAGCARVHEAELKIKCQISKYQICLGCMACASVCRHDAIKITGGSEGCVYTIDDKKCVRCGMCINHFDGGCYMRDVIRTKLEDGNDDT